MMLPRGFFERDTETVARELIGQILVRDAPEGETRGVIVETEAYLGKRDPAAHSYKGSANRVRALYGEKGIAYIYLIYGMYYCLNVAAGGPGDPECVLIRALEPVCGLSLIEERRKNAPARLLCSGPGRLCKAMDITGALYGADLCSASSRLRLEYGEPPASIVTATRIGIEYSGEAASYPWRFYAEGNPNVSKF